MSDQPICSLRSVSRTYGADIQLVVALNQVNLDVYPGELVAVMGPSGCGKSTLLNVAGAMDMPTAGSVTVAGQNLGALSKAQLAAMRRQHIGFVFQELNLIPALTAAENVALPLELDGVSAKKAATAAREALEEVGVPELANRFPGAMSGGQQQRVAIARALIGTRGLLLADEPTGALDSRTGDEILSVLRDRCDAGAAGLVVTHEARHAGWADRVVYLRDGEIVDSDTATASAAPQVVLTRDEDDLDDLDAFEDADNGAH